MLLVANVKNNSLRETLSTCFSARSGIARGSPSDRSIVLHVLLQNLARSIASFCFYGSWFLRTIAHDYGPTY
jgi:hypothetical protein